MLASSSGATAHCVGRPRHALRSGNPRFSPKGAPFCALTQLRAEARRRSDCRAASEQQDAPQVSNDEYDTLNDDLEAAAKSVEEGLGGTSLYLVGMVGSGTTSVGKILAKMLGYCFFDTNQLIEQLSKQSVEEIRDKEGLGAFRKLETQMLSELKQYTRCVIVTGEGAATSRENWGLIRGGIVAFLDGAPATLAYRSLVAAGGDRSASEEESGSGSSQGAPDEVAVAKAAAEIAATMEERRSLYGYSDVTVSIEVQDGRVSASGASAPTVALRVLQDVDKRIKDSAREREERKNFEIVHEGEMPSTMQVMDSPAAAREQPTPAEADT